MADHHEEEQLGKLYDARAARRLIRYLGPYKRMVAVALVLTGGLNLTRQVGPLLTKWAIDDYVKPASEGVMGLEGAFHGIAILTLVYILSLAVTLGVGYFQDVLLNTIGQRVMYDLREQIFGKLQTIEVAFYDSNPVGRLITRLTTDVDALNELFTSGLVEVLGDVVLIAGALGMMFYFNWRLALVSLTVVPLLVAATACYLVDLFTAFLVPDLSKQIHPFIVIVPAIAEIWMVVYLLVVGVKNVNPDKLILAAARA
jgi:ATP-binding cassette subfamily B protein